MKNIQELIDEKIRQETSEQPVCSRCGLNFPNLTDHYGQLLCEECENDLKVECEHND